jgi:hypothetical protein
MNNLIWFNQEGDALNMSQDSNTGIYNGTLFFDENSSDTFKTIGLYLFESVAPINLNSIGGDLSTQKFQLFNENRITITGNSNFTQSVVGISASNNSALFYSKWIYGQDFDIKFPVGSCITFNNNIFEFNNPAITFTVVSVQKDAIMIVTPTDNRTFTSLYGGLTFSNITISGLNTIGIYDYRRGVDNQLSSWNEPKFFDLLYNKKKLTIINATNSSTNQIKSSAANSLVTIKSNSFTDRRYYEYSIGALSYTQSQNLNVQLTLNADLPNIYSGYINIVTNTSSNTSNLYFGDSVPQLILKPGTSFVINNSLLNTNQITVGNVSYFTGNVVTTYYATQSQVIWNNIIYECTQAYTWNATSSINPDNSSYWTSSITYLPSQNTLINENLLNGTIHLVTNKLNFTQAYTQSNNVTMGLFAQNNTDLFSLFNINLYYDNGYLKSDLIWGSKYATVDYFVGNATQSITTTNIINEYIFSTEEILTPQINTNISSNFKYSMAITDIDEFGIQFVINDNIYAENIEYVYTGLNIDQTKTIDRTLRNFVFNNFARLTSIGINPVLESNIYNPEFDFYKDTIIFETIYPNVPLKLSVQMGSLASYYIKHSEINFSDLGTYLNININNKTYGQVVASLTASYFQPDIATAVTNWVNNYANILRGYGILVSNTRNILYFNVIEPSTRLDYVITTNKSAVPSIEQWKITNYLTGNFGLLIAGNQVVLSATSSQSFETAGFATGMITAVNNTPYPYNNQEYNTIYVDSNQLGLSYQGPFFQSQLNECTLSAFTTLAFSPLAYGVTACPVISTTGGSGGAYYITEYSSGFNITYVYTNSYEVYTLNSGNTNLGDMIYINKFENIYTGGYNISNIDAKQFILNDIITLPSHIGVKKMVYNSYNNYIYAITSNNIMIIDPVTDTYLATINMTAFDILINQANGDVYVTDGTGYLKIYYYNNFTNIANTSITIVGAGKMEYNLIDKYIYIIGTSNLYTINTTYRLLQDTISITDPDNRYIFTEPIYGSIYVWGDTVLGTSNTLYKYTQGVMTTISLSNTDDNKLLYNNLTGDLFLTQLNGNFTRITSDNAIVYSQLLDYGDIVVSQYDSDIYMITPGGKLIVIDANSGSEKYNNTTAPFGVPCKKIIYNPLRDSIIVMTVAGELIEVTVTLNNSIALSFTASSPSSVGDGLFGTLNPNYVAPTDIWLKTRQYIRAPRVNYSDSNEPQAKLVYKFVDDQTPQIFMFDLSGNQLSTGTSFSYIGPKPLENAYLIDTPNTDLSRISDPTAQQTIFAEIVTTLDYLDSSTDISILPEPIELFLGYNNVIEGYDKTTLKMYERWDISLTMSYNANYYNQITFINSGTSSQYPNGYGAIELDINSIQSFLYDLDDNPTGLQVGQLIKLTVTDVTNLTNKYLSYNNGQEFIISSISNNQIIVEYITTSNGITSSIYDESNVITNYPSSGDTTYLQIVFTTIDKQIANIDLYGQTEIEDVRYAVELYNSGGHVINPEDAYIFKTYDINEQGIDWSFLNKKRKEMLIVRSQIFPYIGSYKAIINAINYFGYNDLELYEYYRNINVNSPNFYKLFKVEIPDIFDNSVKGWTTNDFIANTMPNPNFEETNLFNLTYLITDKQGNNVQMYSLQEVLIKLQGLKKWLESRVIPITHKILDISGRADFRGGNYIVHKPFARKSYKISQTMTPIDFDVNEAYLMPVNSGSTVYNAVIDFKCSTKDITTIPNNFTVLIRTYKTYLEWNPFTIYSIDDEVTYYGIVYKSAINNNKLNDPRKYANITDWSSSIDYYNGQIVNYKRNIYEYVGTQSTFVEFGTQSTAIYSIPTPYQTDLWLNISQWVIQDLVPVQTIREYRYIDVNSLTFSTTNTNVLWYANNSKPKETIQASLPFNFSVDSNIDPFITIEVSSNNEYGLVYTSKKNYEIRGLNDLYVGVPVGDSMGPFIPITPVTNHI